MAVFAPQFNDHKTINLLRKVSHGFFFAILIFSVAPLVSQSSKYYEHVIFYSNLLNIICLVVYFILEAIVDFFLFPAAEDIRRSDFIDNSWGTKYQIESSQKYFDNDELKPGLYKMAVNLFENSFLSYNISKAMSGSKIILNSIFGLTVLVIACFGLANVSFAIPLLQVIFSSMVIGNLIKHLRFVTRMKLTIERWQEIFQEENFKVHPDKYRALVYRNWIYYEATLARCQISLSDKIFNKFNQRLTHEWEKIKIKYKIE